MKLIPLSKGQFAQVDDKDFEYLNQWKWSAYKSKSDNTYYAGRTKQIKGNKRNLSMHRVILNLTDPKIFCDHKDRNGLNNQRNNLRIATRSQNMANSISRKNSSSKYLGVSLLVNKDKYGVYIYWQALIQKDNKLMRIGLFKNEVDAAIAYNKKAIELHGEFANLNKIEQS